MIEQILGLFLEEELLKADGFDEAIIGIDESTMRLIYSVSGCLEILMVEMEYYEAVEYFNFNIAGAYVGPKTPIWCYDDFS